MQSRDLFTSKIYKGCYLTDGKNVVKDRDFGNAAKISIKPSERKLRQNTEYTFQVTVMSEIGDPKNPLTRFVLIHHF